MNLDYDALGDWISRNPKYNFCHTFASVFEAAYKNQDLVTIQYLVDHYKFNYECEILNINEPEIFAESLTYYNVDLVKYMLTTWPNLSNIFSNTDYLFNVIEDDCDDVVKYIVENYHQHDTPMIIKLFYFACETNSINCVKYLYSILKPLDTDDVYIGAVRQCVDVEIMLWLYDMDANLLNVNNFMAHLADCCVYGELLSIKKFFDKLTGILNNNQLDELFRRACQHNQIECARWLKYNFPQIDVKHNDDSCFQIKYLGDSEKSANNRRKWLLSFYEECELVPIINFIFQLQIPECQYDDVVVNLITHIAINFDVCGIIIDSKYQSDFDNIVEKANRVFANTKSAKNN